MSSDFHRSPRSKLLGQHSPNRRRACRRHAPEILHQSDLGDRGKHMMHGEFESMKIIHTYMPDFAPRPIAWGTYTSIPNTHFFLCDYKKMIDEMPDPHKFASRLAALHQNSASPNGKFGFHVTNYSGNLPQMNEWEASWEVYFAKCLRKALDLEREAKGDDPEFQVLVPVIFEKVIPRLLRPLESEGRSIKPSLVHGDLWYANSGIDVDSGEPLIFDACCFYAHNECESHPLSLIKRLICIRNEIRLLICMCEQDEFGQWRPICNKFGAKYLAAYHSYVQKSAPKEDYDGRLDLYKL